MRKFTAHYEPQCPTSSAGYVMMAIDYDASDETPSTASQMLNMNDRAGGTVWSPTRFQANLQTGDKMPSKYTRNATVTGDIKNYDVGNLYVAMQGVTAGAVGLLYIEYIVDLFTPQMTGSQQQVSGCVVGNGTAAATIFGTPVTYGNPPCVCANKTITFNQDFEGLIVAGAVGGTMTSLTQTGSGTTMSEMYTAVVSGSATVVSVYLVKVSSGQTMILTAAGATYAGIKVYFADGVYSSMYHLTTPAPSVKRFGEGQNVATPTNASSVSFEPIQQDTLTDSLVEAIAATKSAAAEIKKIRSASTERKH